MFIENAHHPTIALLCSTAGPGRVAVWSLRYRRHFIACLDRVRREYLIVPYGAGNGEVRAVQQHPRVRLGGRRAARAQVRTCRLVYLNWYSRASCAVRDVDRDDHWTSRTQTIVQFNLQIARGPPTTSTGYRSSGYVPGYSTAHETLPL
ncbi:hypothetical protein EVAR_40501_1 [Eumeta japonica]|uniref:Uncharacterized protein n=1 Tax=Eumeta variegata TaxID=151549 RepID=A0A4C1XX49_EUMVA|nr:hypothetical protein EVAR_40501_1 [Eumeta japonica]